MIPGAAEDLRSTLVRLVAAIRGQKRSYTSERLFETRTHSSVTASLRPSLRLWNGAQGSWCFSEPDGARVSASRGEICESYSRLRKITLNMAARW